LSGAQLIQDMPEAPEPQVTFQLEPWEAIATEVQALAERHFAEVDGGVEPRRHLDIDGQLMSYGCKVGAIKIYTARVGPALVGYCTWTISYDVESKGLLIASQGAWYTEQEYQSMAIGLRLFKHTLGELKSLGVQCVFPHHRMQGRGTEDRLGPFFLRLGAKLTQHTYTLWIGE
jgi:hypothetical protein